MSWHAFAGSRVSLLIACCGLFSLPLRAIEPSTEEHVLAAFSDLRHVSAMRPGQSYEVRVGGDVETGVKERFLRRRNAVEIRESGLASGCGDFAVLFVSAMEPRGYEALLVDGAEISSVSLLNHFAGHAVVAIRRKDASAATCWWLVDPTGAKVLSRDWSRAEKSFRAAGRSYWIGYCGPQAEYPVRTPDGLKAFYEETLSEVPREYLNKTLVRIRFVIDPSLRDDHGNALNPRLLRFVKLQTSIFADHGAEPEREVPVLLTRGDESERTQFDYTPKDGWVARVGLRSGCSPGLLSFFEQRIRNEKSEPGGQVGTDD